MRRVPAFLVISAGLLALVGIVRSSLDPEAYPGPRLRQLQYLEESRSDHDHGRATSEPEWRHPTGAVALIGLAVALETAVLYLVFAATGPMPVSHRARRGLAVLLPWGVLMAVLTVKSAPAFAWWHVLWVWLLIASLLVGALVPRRSSAGAREGQGGDR